MKTGPHIVTAALAGALFAAAVLLIAGCRSRPTPLTALPKNGMATMAPGLRAGPDADRFGARKSILEGIPAGEELWVISRTPNAAQAGQDDVPGSGALMTTVEEKLVPMPLKHTDVQASVAGYIGTVDVIQQFYNPYSSKIEAVYVFPLPHNAAVSEFVMTIGERHIRGIIRERKEAEEIYQDAKRQGYVASLLTEERPNVFTQSVANIEPGKQIDVAIKYFHTLAYVDGWYEFVFPMVVGPRFNPPGMTNGIGAVARGQTGVSGQSTEVSYLRPGERTGHDISLKVGIDAGMRIEEFECNTHQVSHQVVSPERLSVALSPADAIPNRDFVLRYRVAGTEVKSGLVTHRDETGGYFSLMLVPPAELSSLRRQPLELVFVVDSSGSMSGRPISEAKAAVQRGLRLLQSGDSFQIINFSMRASKLGPKPLEATPENIERGLDYLRSLEGEGGTMMIEGIKAALDFPHDPQRLRFVCFLTDGYIGNETEILAAIHKRLGPSRIFSFGIGSAVNRYLLDHMAQVGRGAVAYLGPDDSAAKIMGDFFERIGHPALTDVKIDWGGLPVDEIFPQQVPDLFVGRPVVLTGRFSGDTMPAVKVSGRAAGENIQVNVPGQGSPTTHQSLPKIWARAKIAELANQSAYHPDRDLPDQIKQVALDYGLMSAFTAFVAVDSSRRTEGNEGTTVPVAVPVPEGVKYETTVQEENK